MDNMQIKHRVVFQVGDPTNFLLDEELIVEMDLTDSSLNYHGHLLGVMSARYAVDQHITVRGEEYWLASDLDGKTLRAFPTSQSTQKQIELRRRMRDAATRWSPDPDGS